MIDVLRRIKKSCKDKRDSLLDLYSAHDVIKLDVRCDIAKTKINVFYVATVAIILSRVQSNDLSKEGKWFRAHRRTLV